MKSPLDILLSYQRAWVDDDARFKCGLWARQTGKDFSTAAEISRDAMTRDKTTWMIAAPSERQAVESFEKCKDWSQAFDFAIEDVVEERSDGPGTLLKSSEARFGNGSRIIAVPGKPDTVRGFSANVALTEFAFFEDPDKTWRAILPSINNPLRGGVKKMRIISTPNGKSGPGARFYKIVRDNLLNPKEGRKQKWSVHRVSIDDAVAGGLPIDPDELREAMDDPEGAAQELDLEFLDSSNVLLPYDIIALAESGLASEFCDPEMWLGGGRYLGPIFLGIDFGRQNDPTACWASERVGDLLITREVKMLRQMSTPDQVNALRPRIKTAQRVCLDYTGPGIGMGDYLVEEFGEWNPAQHKFGKIELCTFTTKFKRELFPNLRMAFEAPTILRIPVSVEVREDLHAMMQIVKNGEYSYAAPRTAEGHSDRCTALALCVRASSGAGGFVEYEGLNLNLGGDDRSGGGRRSIKGSGLC